MATRSSNTLFCDNSTDAHFQAWVQFVEDTLVSTGGWVVTADTGQMTISTASHPTTANTKVGYRVYRMNDPLQTTSPVFMRVDYGSSSASQNPSVWLTIGTGSDGAGTITSIRLNAKQIGAGSSSATLANNSYGSASTDRFQIALFIQASSTNYPIVISLERTKDAFGVDTSSGLLLLYMGSSIQAGFSNAQYVDLTAVSQPPTESGVTYVLANQNPSVFNNDIGVAIPILFKGAAVQPGVGIAIVRSSDFAAQATFTVSLYGATRTFQQLDSQVIPYVPTGGSNSQDSTARTCLLFD